MQTILHEPAVAVEMKRERWYAIFQGHNLRRTIASTWALSSQQVLGLTLFYTYASYFFKTAGIADPFAVTCITNGIQLAIIILVAISVDFIGRRNVCCGGLCTTLVAVTLIGILGVTKTSNATNKLLVFFSCIYSESYLFMRGAGSQDTQSWVCNAPVRPAGVLSAKSPHSVFDPTPQVSLRPSPASAALS